MYLSFQVIVIMVVYIDDNKLVIITEPKSIRIDLPIKINESLKFVELLKFAMNL